MKSPIPVVQKSRLRFLLFSLAPLLLLQVPVATAEEIVGEVMRSQNMPEYPVGKKITQETQIKTDSDQRIAIKTSDGDTLIAGSNAVIKLQKPGFFSHLFGKIYYLIRPLKKRSVTVQTRAATIGIRGTKFIIDSAGEDSSEENVSLVEGKLNFESNDDELFELYEQREMDEFEKFKQQYQSEFNEYKEQMMEEFVAYKKSIDLEAGFALRFDGKKVTRAALDEEMDAEIAEFEKFLSENSLH